MDGVGGNDHAAAGHLVADQLGVEVSRSATKRISGVMVPLRADSSWVIASPRRYEPDQVPGYTLSPPQADTPAANHPMIVGGVANRPAGSMVRKRRMITMKIRIS